MKYHESMSDPSAELYELVAETNALLQSLRLQGVILVPAGVPGLGGGRSPVAEGEVGASSAPRRADTAPPPRAAAPTPPTRAGQSRPLPHAPATPRPAPPLAPDAPAGGLLGRWGERLVPVDDRVAAVALQAGKTCEGCGEPTLSGTGGLRSGMILVAAPATGAAQTMLANMLLKVVAVEPLDVWHVFPRPCSTCAATLERFVLAIRPRVILGLGAEARAMLGQPALGAWVRFAQIETIVSWHPDEIEADSSRKRAVFGHLQELSKKR